MMIYFLVIDEHYSHSLQGSVISVEEGTEAQLEVEEEVGIKW